MTSYLYSIFPSGVFAITPKTSNKTYTNTNTDILISKHAPKSKSNHKEGKKGNKKINLKKQYDLHQPPP